MRARYPAKPSRRDQVNPLSSGLYHRRPSMLSGGERRAKNTSATSWRALPCLPRGATPPTGGAEYIVSAAYQGELAPDSKIVAYRNHAQKQGSSGPLRRPSAELNRQLPGTSAVVPSSPRHRSRHRRPPGAPPMRDGRLATLKSPTILASSALARGILVGRHAQRSLVAVSSSSCCAR